MATELKLALQGQWDIIYETIWSDDPRVLRSNQYNGGGQLIQHPSLCPPLPLTINLPEMEVDSMLLGVGRSSTTKVAEVKPRGIREKSMVMVVDKEAEVVKETVDKGKRKVVAGGKVVTAAAGMKQQRMQLVKSSEMVGITEKEEEEEVEVEAPLRKKVVIQSPSALRRPASRVRQVRPARQNEDEEDEEEDEEDELAPVKRKEVAKDAPWGRVLSKVKWVRPAHRDEDEDDIDPSGPCVSKVKCSKSVARSLQAREEGRHPAPSSVIDAAAAAIPSSPEAEPSRSCRRSVQAAKITTPLTAPPTTPATHKVVIREWHGHPMHKEGSTSGVPPSSRMLAKLMKVEVVIPTRGFTRLA
ncbi:hypothetical protein EW146_g9531, partial [Bondarzewia mesenterica]